jgi:hypothetical protein
MNKRPFLGNGSVNTHTIEKLLKAVFSIWSASRLYKEDPRPAELITEKGWQRDNCQLQKRIGLRVLELIVVSWD